MKDELGISIMGIFLTLILSFFIFNLQNFSITGSAIDEELSNGSIVITKADALNSINQSENIIGEMEEYNFSITYMNDELLEAKRVFERARYAEILRSGNSSDSEILEARKALQLIDWKKITYTNVLVHTNNIENKSEEAFIIFDSITAAGIRINNYKEDKIDVNEAVGLLESAEISFYDGRYEEAKRLLEDIENNLETKKTETATLNVLRKGTQNFIQRYWIQISLVLISFGVIGFFTYKKISKKLLVKKVKKMKVEKEVLLDLMKKVQIGRYKENNISKAVYEIRMDKYKKRLIEINEILPVLERELNSRNKKISLLSPKKET